MPPALPLPMPVQPVRSHRLAPRRATGMVEVLVATVIVGMMIVAALNAAGMSARTRRINADRLSGPCMVRDLLAEVISLPYEDPQNPGGANGVDAGESASSRATFDDVDDYDGYVLVGSAAKDGTARSGYSGWSFWVSVTWAERISASSWSSYDTMLKRIIVTSYSPTGSISQAMGLRAKHGALEQSLPIENVAVGWTGVELRAGASARSQFTAAPLANVVSDAN